MPFDFHFDSFTCNIITHKIEFTSAILTFLQYVFYIFCSLFLNFCLFYVCWIDIFSCVCVCMLNCFSHVWLFETPWTVARQSPLSRGFSGQEYWSGLLCPPPGDLPNPGIESVSLMYPSLAGGFFITSATWETHILVHSHCVD